jgi:hypothetical protein
MATTNQDRSQPLLRIPREQTPVTIVLDGGERTSATLFVPPGSSVLRMLTDGAPFIPVAFTGAFGGGTRLIARATIACISVHVLHAHVEEHEALGERQKVTVQLRGGQSVKGELRWLPEAMSRRVLDHLNDQTAYLVIHEGEYINFVAKSHVASVGEL